MPVYFGEMQVKDEVNRIPATVTIYQGRLSLSSGTTELGDWSLSHIGMELYTDKSVLLAADDATLILFLEDHDQFVRDNSRHMREPEGTRRRPEHAAFRKQDPNAPTLGAEIRDDVSREVTPIIADAKHLLSLIEPGPPLWIGAAMVLALIIFAPGIVIGLGLLVGVLALVAGGLAYADDKIAVRIPEPFTPTMLVLVGAVSVILAIFVNLAFT